MINNDDYYLKNMYYQRYLFSLSVRIQDAKIYSIKIFIINNQAIPFYLKF
jgi:hypothetical protein